MSASNAIRQLQAESGMTDATLLGLLLDYVDQYAEEGHVTEYVNMNRYNLKPEERVLTADDVLREFVEDVNSTGGLAYDPMGRVDVPNAADDWSGLAVTYKKACRVLGVEPEYSEDEDDEYGS